MTKTYSLTQVVQEANSRLAAEGLEPALNERLVRYYTSEKKVLEPPAKEGREARYTEDHVEQLVTLRRAQSLGFTADAYGQTLKYTNNNPNDISGAAAGVSMFAASAGLGSALLDAHIQTNNVQPAYSTSGTNSAQTKALSYLRGLDPQQKNDALLEQSSKLLKNPPQAQPAFETWVSMDVMPGIRLQIREDVLSGFNATDERHIIDAVKNIRKAKT